MTRTPDGPPPAPAVQRLRVRHAKRGRLRFASHRDFQRAFERALRRAGVPVAYSAGFSRHPKVSYAGAAPTGTASEAEYLEVALTERWAPDRLRAALDASLPPGLDILEVVEASTPAFAERLHASVWEIILPGVEPAAAAAAAAAFLAQPVVEVERLTKHGVRAFDARAAVARLEVLEVHPHAELADEAGCAILRLVVRQVSPAVRPDDVLSGLRQVADLAPPSPPVVTRLAQGPLDEQTGAVADPLAPDRGVGAATDRDARPGQSDGIVISASARP
jgi:radical SAM-linked protein